MPREPLPESKESISRFEKLLADLARNHIDFALVGGLAVILNGYPRLTLDADIIVRDNPENIQKLLAQLQTWGEGWARELNVDDFAPQEGSIRVTEDFDLDIFTRMRGRSYEQFQPRFQYLDSDGARIPYLAAEDLLYLKQGSWREKDQLDVLAMKEILRRKNEET